MNTKGWGILQIHMYPCSVDYSQPKENTNASPNINNKLQVVGRIILGTPAAIRSQAAVGAI